MRVVLVWAALCAAAAGVAALIASAAAAQQPNCKPRAEMLADLKQRYGEDIIGGGISDRGLLMILLRSPLGETWSVVAMRTDGQACIVDGGTDWTDYVPPAQVPGLPS